MKNTNSLADKSIKGTDVSISPGMVKQFLSLALAGTFKRLLYETHSFSCAEPYYV